uniref:Uncharacterized protein n=2 Tax=Aegilops tauschii subsp. strangulata TaxID=200361 RepID=A0A453CHQ6_AEGTS
MNWIGRKIHLYNVNIGLYMLDWWERYLFNTLMLCLLWYILRYLTGFFQRVIWRPSYKVRTIFYKVVNRRRQKHIC